MKRNEKRLLDTVEELYQFRSRIPANLTVEKVKEVWGIDIKQEKFPKVIEPRKNIIEEKVEITQKSLNQILLKPIVRFIGISGSVASEFVQRDDDIDLFIVVKNDTVWIYRLYIYIKNLFKRNIRSKGNPNVKDKLCINFLVEQRALDFEQDIFNLNELTYLKPIYNKEFLNIIFLSNLWLEEKYLISEKFLGKRNLKVGDVKKIGKRNYFLLPVNFLAFLFQLVFMLVTKHNPDIKRLFKGFRDGEVQFYPEDFKEEKLKEIKVD